MGDNNPLKRWSRGTYRCADGTKITCKQETVKLDKMFLRKLPMNGIQSVNKDLLTIVSGVVLNRAMAKVIRGGPAQTYTFPRTVSTVCEKAFENTNIASVRLNEGLRTLKEYCFQNSTVRKLVLPASVCEISGSAFGECRYLQYADLSAAHGLQTLNNYVFSNCDRLRQVLLNEGLETICPGCFSESGV